MDYIKNDLQKIYTLNLIAILTTCIFLIGHVVLSVLSVIEINERTNLWIAVLLLIFSISGLSMRSSNKSHAIKLPHFMPKIFITFLQISATFAFLVSMFYLGNFPAPIYQNGDTFTDKAGHEYTYSQFQESQKRELVYLTSFSVLWLLITVTVPFYDKRTRKWIFS